jgi:hypothetical protein
MGMLGSTAERLFAVALVGEQAVEFKPCHG